MPKGKVKWFDAKKGYGFVTTENDGDVFVHYSDIQTEQSYKTLEEGVEVEYELVDDERGKKAANVKPVEA